jgi:hypothetical protein
MLSHTYLQYVISYIPTGNCQCYLIHTCGGPRGGATVLHPAESRGLFDCRRFRPFRGRRRPVYIVW